MMNKLIARIVNKALCIGVFILCSSLAVAMPEQKSMSVGPGTIKYYQIGNGAPVLLVHGLFANKEQWLPLVQELIKQDPHIVQKFQFIIPDLPGYGNSTDYPIDVYNLDSGALKPSATLTQVHLLHDFVNQLHINAPLNIAGNSMGGLIMVLYTIHYSKEVNSIAFIGSPLGISPFDKRVINSGFRHGYNPFTPTTPEQFHNELYLLLVNYPAITPNDEDIKTKVIPYIERNFKTMTAAFNMINLPYYTEYLKKPLKITQPALILWGTQDYIFGEVTHAKELCANLVQSKKCLWYPISKAGHVMMLEQPDVLQLIANYYLNFLRANNP